ncbi:MAG: thioredoxin family protein [Sedimentisphaerales bacterium]|nr:thioredoxin family protein [Sedimentisphaerales bacterium]
MATAAGIWLLVSWARSVCRKEGVSLMNKVGKIGIVVALIAVVIIVIAVKQNQSIRDSVPATDAVSIGPVAVGGEPAEYKPENFVGKGLPALIDIGAGTCIPCRLMAPILEELKKELQGKAIVQFIDLNKYPGAASEYRIRVMPTQIFYDASGKELFRHEGFYSKDDVLAKWKELGIDLTEPALQSLTPKRLSPVKPDDAPEEESTTKPYSPPPKSQAVKDLYPGLTTGAFIYAVTSELPEGVLLKAGDMFIKDEDVDKKISEASEQMRPQLRKNVIFVLEQIATSKLILYEAETEAAKIGTDISHKEEGAIIQDYLRKSTERIEVGDAEILDFYNSNKETVGDAALAQVKPQIEQFLLQQKQQEFIDEHIRTIGKRMRIEISAPWLKVKAALSLDNPVDKARASGKPTLVELGASGCIPCDMMQPILDALSEKNGEKINIIFVHVGQEQILGARYGIQSIPVQIFFDKNGKEFFRHAGFFPQEEVEKKLSEMGVK